MFDNQGRRRVLVDENLFRQLLNQIQVPNENRVLVPRPDTAANEYRVFDENSINNNDISEYLDGATEIDLNQRRNNVPEGTFGQMKTVQLH